MPILLPFAHSNCPAGRIGLGLGLLVALGAVSNPAAAQARLNLALEQHANHGRPLVLWATKVFPGTTLRFDSVVVRQGRSSLRFDLDSAADTPYAALYTLFSYPVDSVRGRIVTVSAWVRTRGFRGRGGIYAYAHTPPVGGDIGLDRLDKLDSLAATTDWQRLELRLPVKATATAFGLGLRVLGSGHIWFDDVQVRLGSRLLADAPQPGTETLLLSPADALAPNWGFERLPPPATRPAPDHLRLGLDTLAPQHGRRALVLAPAASTAPAPPAYLGTLALGQLRGHILTVRGYWRQPTAASAAANPAAPVFSYTLLGHDGGAGVLASYVVSRHLAPATPQRPGPAWSVFTLRIPVPNAANLAALALAVQPGDGPALGLDNLQFSLDGQPYAPAAPVLAAAPTAAETAWLRQQISPLAPPPPPGALPNLAAVGALVGDAQVVGLGEVTHGSQEIFQLKHQLVRYLIAQKGFGGVVLEAPQPACAALNEYIQTGQGDPARLLRALGQWNTTEALALVRWLRAYRQQPGGRPVFLAGLDMQQPELALAALRQATPPTDAFAARRFAQLTTALAAMSRPGGAGFDLRQQPNQPADPLLQTVRRLVGELRAGLDTRAKLTGGDPVAARTLARQLLALRLLEQGATFRRLPMDLAGNYRAACLAENVEQLAQPAGPAAPAPKLVVWAPNGLVARAGPPDYRPLGQWLASRRGPGYVALGFACGQGHYAAEGGTGTLYAAPAPLGAYEAWFATVPTAFVLDLRRPVLAEAGAWLFQQQLFREGGVPETARPFRRHSLRAEFDGVLYLPTSTAALRL